MYDRVHIRLYALAHADTGSRGMGNDLIGGTDRQHEAYPPSAHPSAIAYSTVTSGETHPIIPPGTKRGRNASGGFKDHVEGGELVRNWAHPYYRSDGPSIQTPPSVPTESPPNNLAVDLPVRLSPIESPISMNSPSRRRIHVSYGSNSSGGSTPILVRIREVDLPHRRMGMGFLKADT